jgi:MSHA biogenesis protein MshJ
MKELLAGWAERVDALAVRQRVMVFIALALILVFAVHAAYIQPLRARERAVAAQIAQQHTEMAALQAQLQRVIQGSAADPDAPNRARRAALQEELRKLNSRITQEQRRFTPPERMRGILEELLERNRGLALVDLKTLPVVAVQGSRVGQSGAGMYRHGIEVTVRGTYGELYEYLRGLEKLPNQLYWGRAELGVESHPTLTLKLTVHTLSFDRAWLIV